VHFAVLALSFHSDNRRTNFQAPLLSYPVHFPVNQVKFSIFGLGFVASNLLKGGACHQLTQNPIPKTNQGNNNAQESLSHHSGGCLARLVRLLYCLRRH
jgi:hypothetical protein